MYAEPDREIAFGDVFLRDVLFHDAFLADDAAQLGSYLIVPQNAPRFAAGIEKRLNRPVSIPEEGIWIYSPGIPRTGRENFLLAHGLSTHAVVISDDCDIEEAFGREGAEPRGRLLFAAVAESKKEQIEEVQRREPFNRFALPGNDQWQGGIVDLKRLFMVDVRAIPTAPEARAVRLGEELSTALAVTWAAYATRRGPLAAAKNADKLVRLLGERGVGNEEAVKIATAVAEAVAAAWTFEVDGLDAAAVVLDEGGDLSGAEVRLVDTLNAVAAAASAAAAALEASRRS